MKIQDLGDKYVSKNKLNYYEKLTYLNKLNNSSKYIGCMWRKNSLSEKNKNSIELAHI